MDDGGRGRAGQVDRLLCRAVTVPLATVRVSTVAVSTVAVGQQGRHVGPRATGR